MNASRFAVSLAVITTCSLGACGDDDDTNSGIDCTEDPSVCTGDEVCGATHDPERPGLRLCGEPCDAPEDCTGPDPTCCDGACMNVNDCSGE